MGGKAVVSLKEVLDEEVQRWPAEDEMPAVALGSPGLVMVQPPVFQNLVIQVGVLNAR